MNLFKKYFDEKVPKIFSFDKNFGVLNQKIRSQVKGGPCIIFHRHCELKKQVEQYHSSVYSTPDGSKYSKLVSYDFNALYAFSMMQDLPTGIPFYYEKKSNGCFDFKIASEVTGWSKSCLDWLNFMSRDPRFLKDNGEFYLMESFITGEFEIESANGLYRIDGRVVTNDQVYFLEFFGCRFHSCSNCEMEAISDTRDRDRIKLQFLRQHGKVILMRECIWNRLKRQVKFNSPYSYFFYRKNIREEEILSAVLKDQFFGLLEVDLWTPDWLKAKFNEINFGLIFDKISPTEDMLGTKMKNLAKNYGYKFPLNPQLTVVYAVKNYLITSEMLKYYINLGVEVTKLHSCIEFQRSKPLKKFIDLGE